MDGDYEQIAEELLKARTAVDEVRGSADSDDGLVSVTVAVSGEILELVLDPRIYRTPDSTGLAEVIVATVGRAMEDAQRQAFAAVRSFLPPGAEFETTDLALDPMLNRLAPQTFRE